MIPFQMPDAEQRLRLWKHRFADKSFTLADDVDLAALTKKYELSGGSITNVLRHACLQATQRSPQEIREADLVEAISREINLRQ